MIRIKMILSVPICLFCMGILVAEVDVTGNWELTITAPRGERSFSSEFIQNGEDLTVINRGRRGNKIEAKGSVKGSEIEWTVRRETPRGTFEVIYKGKIEKDVMKGTVRFGDFGSGEWSARRARSDANED